MSKAGVLEVCVGVSAHRVWSLFRPSLTPNAKMIASITRPLIAATASCTVMHPNTGVRCG